MGAHNEKRHLEVVQAISELLDELVSKVGSYSDQMTHVIGQPGHQCRKDSLRVAIAVTGTL